MSSKFKRISILLLALVALVSVMALSVFAAEETYVYKKTLYKGNGELVYSWDSAEEAFNVPIDSSVTFDFTGSVGRYDTEARYNLEVCDYDTGAVVCSYKGEKDWGGLVSEKPVFDLAAGTYIWRVTPGKVGLGLTYNLKITCSRVFTTSDPYYYFSSVKDGPVYKDKPVQLKLNVLPKSAKISKITWSSSPKSVATVNSKGKVTVKKSGFFTVTAKVGNQKTSVFLEGVAPKYSKLKNFSLYQGMTERLKIDVTPADYPVKSIKWKSSNKSVATVSAKGLVTAKKPGKTTITATINGQKISCKLTVKAPKINTAKKTIYVKETYLLEVLGGTGKTTWKSSDKSIATVNSKGKVTAKKPGKTTITAKKNGKTYKSTITVKWPPENGITEIKNIDLSNSIHGESYEFTLKGKTTITISGKVNAGTDSLYVVLYHDGYQKWSKFIYQEDGKVTHKVTLEAGDCRLYYSTESDAELTLKTVTKPQIVSTTGTNKVGKGYTMKMSLVGNKHSGTWSSSNKKIATVNSKGVISAKKKGTCKIYCTLKDGKKLSYTIKVVDPVTVEPVRVYDTSILNECDIRFTNYTNKTIEYVDFNIRQYNYKGKKVSGPYSYYYCDDKIKPGESLTLEYWIADEAKTISTYIKKVKFPAGTTWKP